MTHTCALDTDHHAWCWGSGLDGELGEGMTTFSRLVPVAVVGPS